MTSHSEVVEQDDRGNFYLVRRPWTQQVWFTDQDGLDGLAVGGDIGPTDEIHSMWFCRVTFSSMSKK